LFKLFPKIVFIVFEDYFFFAIVLRMFPYKKNIKKAAKRLLLGLSFGETIFSKTVLLQNHLAFRVVHVFSVR